LVKDSLVLPILPGRVLLFALEAGKARYSGSGGFRLLLFVISSTPGV
jgi:hypothetical protein